MKKDKAVFIIEALFIIMVTLWYSMYTYESMKQSAIEDDIWGANMDIMFALILAVPLYLAIGDICFNIRYWVLGDAKKTKIKNALNLIAGIVSLTLLLSLLGTLKVVEFPTLNAIQFFDVVLILTAMEIAIKIIYFWIHTRLLAKNKRINFG